MHERKAVMADAAEAFIMLPGGYGTLDEFFEVLTWAQLGIHRKPCGILDVGAYFGPLRAFIDSAVSAGFVHPENRDRVQVDSDPGRLLDAMAAWEPPAVTSGWITPSAKKRSFLARAASSARWGSAGSGREPVLCRYGDTLDAWLRRG